MRRIIIIIHNVRSAHNVGSILRSADGFGVEHVYMSGYTPYPEAKDDTRLPHIARRVAAQIKKTALGAENTVKWTYRNDITGLISELKKDYQVAALEQTPMATPLQDFKASKDIALIVGSEISGLEPRVLNSVDLHLEIPMKGQKESFNVAVAAAVAMYSLRTADAL